MIFKHSNNLNLNKFIIEEKNNYIISLFESN